MTDEKKSSCKYCNGSRKPLPIDTLACTVAPDEAVIEGENEENPAISVLVDGIWVYIRARFCPQCGRRLGADEGR